MKLFIRSILVLCLLAMPAWAQTTTQVAGSGQSTVTGGLTIKLLNPQSIYTNSQIFAFNPLFNANFGYGTNGVGVANANQFFAGQFKITNGALVGTNVFNLHTMTFSNAPSGIVAPNDAVGNAFSLLNLKVLAFQNLGVVGAPAESNVLDVVLPTGAIQFTNVYGHPFLETSIGGPPTNAVSSNTPCVLSFNAGDVGWIVGATASNSILFTNPVASSVVLVNVYALGSTNQ